MKMWTTLSAGHWICLLPLAAALLVSASKEDLLRHPPCCLKANRYIDKVITECIKQKANRYCRSNNFAVRVEGGKWYCITSDSKWMNMQIQKGNVSCRKE